MLTAAERRKYAAMLGWDMDGAALGRLESALDGAFGAEAPVLGGCAGGEAFPRRARTLTLWELARQRLGEEQAAAVFLAEAERVNGWQYGDADAALDALARAIGPVASTATELGEKVRLMKQAEAEGGATNGQDN